MESRVEAYAVMLIYDSSQKFMWKQLLHLSNSATNTKEAHFNLYGTLVQNIGTTILPKCTKSKDQLRPMGMRFGSQTGYEDIGYTF